MSVQKEEKNVKAETVLLLKLVEVYLSNNLP